MSEKNPKKLFEAVHAAAGQPERQQHLTRPSSAPVTDTPDPTSRRQRYRRIQAPGSRGTPAGSRRRHSEDAVGSGTVSEAPASSSVAEAPVFSSVSEAPASSPQRDLSTSRAAKSREGMKSITGQFPPEVNQQLRLLAHHTDNTSQALLQEAVADLFSKYQTMEAAAPGARTQRPQPEGPTIKISAWLPERDKKHLGFLKIKHSKSLQALFGEALNDLFDKYRLPTIVPEYYRS